MIQFSTSEASCQTDSAARKTGDEEDDYGNLEYKLKVVDDQYQYRLAIALICLLCRFL